MLISFVALPLLSMIVSKTVMAESPIWTMTTYFGEIDEVHKIPHAGIDLACPLNSHIDSITDGTVIDVRHAGDKSWGNSIHIKDPFGREVIYGHLNKTEVEIGQTIHMGDEIGLSGSTGISTGGHLHLEIKLNGKPIDPMRDIMRAAIGRHE